MKLRPLRTTSLLFVGAAILLLIVLLGLRISRDREEKSLTSTLPSKLKLVPTISVSWNGIKPGETTIDQVLTILGPPNANLNVGDYQIFRYCDQDTLLWKLVEVWFKPNESQYAKAIFRTIPYDNQGISIEPIGLLSIIDKYNLPDRVTWGTLRNGRYLIWSRYGIAVNSVATTDIFGWDELEYSEILLFEPMRIEEFMAEPWPWPLHSSGFSDHNLFTDTDAPDTYPLDPYDWGHMPTPYP